MIKKGAVLLKVLSAITDKVDLAKEKALKISVCIPTYNMGQFIGRTIKSVLAQTFKDFEVIISDNNSQDNTEQVINYFRDPRIKYFKNQANLGFAKNLELCRQRAACDIIYLLAAKSLISKDALENTYKAFQLSADIGAVTRPYYWFGEDVRAVVRKKEQYDKEKDAVISINDGIKAVIAVFKTLDNPGGLAYRRSFIDTPFHDDPFVEAAYPFASIFKKHKIVYLKDYTMACPAFLPSGSQNPLIYKKSPVRIWVNLFRNVLYEKEFREIRNRCIKDFIAVNYIGLVQIRNYAKYRYLLREISLLIRYRWQNIFNLKFWFFSIGTMVIPKRILIRLVEIYKKRLNSKIIELKNRNHNIYFNA